MMILSTFYSWVLLFQGDSYLNQTATVIERDKRRQNDKRMFQYTYDTSKNEMRFNIDYYHRGICMFIE